MLLVKNKKATWNYEIIEKFVAGIMLKGYETKALREGNGSFEGAYIKMEENVPILVNANIGKYSKQSQEIEKTDPKRDRKLLLNKNEIRKIQRALEEKGKTAVPLAFLLQHNLIKLELAIVKGQKEYEKKHVAKEKQIKKDLDKFNSLIRRSI